MPKYASSRLLSFVYGQMGVLEAAGCFFAYFVVLGENGFLPRTVFGISPLWDSKFINNLEDSYGQEWVRTLFVQSQLGDYCLAF